MTWWSGGGGTIGEVFVNGFLWVALWCFWAATRRVEKEWGRKAGSAFWKTSVRSRGAVCVKLLRGASVSYRCQGRDDRGLCS